MEKSRIQIVLEALDEASAELKQVRTELKGLDKAGVQANKGTGSFWNQLKGIQSTAIATAGTLAAVGIAAKKAFDLGKEGSVVKQTAESFEYLLDKVEVAPYILEKVRVASNNTVDDMTIMSGMNTLVAGTTDKVSKALLEAAPELMSYAKAANKLNPSLGTTDYMFRSIAEGIKKGQPEILDNLGLAIKMQPAYEAYAESVGKTVDQLDAEEKILAVLNDTKRAGAVLIEQVGGSTEASTDSFEQLNTAAKRFGDYLRTKLTPAAQGFADVMTKGLNDATSAMESYDSENKLFRAAAEEGIISYEAIQQALYATKDNEEAREEIIRRLTTQLTAHNMAQMDAVTSSELMNEAHALIAGTLSEVTLGVDQTAESTAAYQQFQSQLVDATLAYVEAERNAVIETANLSITMKNATGADIAKQSIESLTTAFNLGKISESEYRGELEEIGKKYGLVNDRSLQLAQGQMLLEDALRTGAMPATSDYSEAVDFLYQNSGNVDDINQALIDKFGIMPEKLGANKKSFEDTAKSLQEKFNVEIGTANDYLTGIFALPDYKDFTFTVRWVEEGSPPNGLTYDTSRKLDIDEEPYTGATGLHMTVPPGYPNDSFYMPLALTSGEELNVTPRSMIGQNPSGGGGNVIIQLTYAPLFSAGDEYEFEDRLWPFIENGLRRAGVI